MSSQPHTALGMCFIMNIDWDIEIFMGHGWCELGVLAGGGLMVWNCIPGGWKWKRKNSSWSGSFEASFWDAPSREYVKMLSAKYLQNGFYFGAFSGVTENSFFWGSNMTTLRHPLSRFKTLQPSQNTVTLDYPTEVNFTPSVTLFGSMQPAHNRH